MTRLARNQEIACALSFKLDDLDFTEPFICIRVCPIRGWRPFVNSVRAVYHNAIQALPWQNLKGLTSHVDFSVPDVVMLIIRAVAPPHLEGMPTRTPSELEDLLFLRDAFQCEWYDREEELRPELIARALAVSRRIEGLILDRDGDESDVVALYDQIYDMTAYLSVLT